MSEQKPLYESPGEKGKRGFESLYKLIRQTEQGLNGFMTYVRGQRAGSQDDGAKRLGDSQTDYDMTFFEEEND